MKLKPRARQGERQKKTLAGAALMRGKVSLKHCKNLTSFLPLPNLCLGTRDNSTWCVGGAALL